MLTTYKGEKYVEDTQQVERFLFRAKDALKSRLDNIRDQIKVTVVGTVVVTTDTANPQVQLTKTPYALPYIKTEDATVSVPENFSDADQGYKFSITSMPKLLDALDGVADGGELVVSGGFDTDTAWTTGDLATLS